MLKAGRDVASGQQGFIAAGCKVFMLPCRTRQQYYSQTQHLGPLHVFGTKPQYEPLVWV